MQDVVDIVECQVCKSCFKNDDIADRIFTIMSKHYNGIDQQMMLCNNRQCHNVVSVRQNRQCRKCVSVAIAVLTCSACIVLKCRKRTCPKNPEICPRPDLILIGCYLQIKKNMLKNSRRSQGLSYDLLYDLCFGIRQGSAFPPNVGKTQYNVIIMYQISFSKLQST